MKRLGFILGLLCLLPKWGQAGVVLVAATGASQTSAAALTQTLPVTVISTADTFTLHLHLHQNQTLTGTAVVLDGATALTVDAKVIQSGGSSEDIFYSWAPSTTGSHSLGATWPAGGGSQSQMVALEWSGSTGIGAIFTKSVAFNATANLTLTAGVGSAMVVQSGEGNSGWAPDGSLTAIWNVAYVYGYVGYKNPVTGFQSVTQTGTAGCNIAFELVASNATPTPTFTASPTNTPSPTQTNTGSPTPTSTASPTATPTSTFTASPTPTVTNTPIPCGIPDNPQSKPNPEPALQAWFDTFSLSGFVTQPGPCTGAPIIASGPRIVKPNHAAAFTGESLTTMVEYTQSTGGNAKLITLTPLSNSTENWLHNVSANTLPAAAHAFFPTTFTVSAGSSTIYGAPWFAGVARLFFVSAVGDNDIVASVGDTLHAVGTGYALNLTPEVAVIDAAGTSYTATITGWDPYRVDFTLPAAVTGVAQVWTHNGHGQEYGWAGPALLTISAAVSWSGSTVQPETFGADPTGVGDSTYALTHCASVVNGNFGTVSLTAGAIYRTKLAIDGGANKARWLGNTATILVDPAFTDSQVIGTQNGTKHQYVWFENMTINAMAMSSTAAISTKSVILDTYLGNFMYKAISISAQYNTANGLTASASQEMIAYQFKTGGSNICGPGTVTGNYLYTTGGLLSLYTQMNVTNNKFYLRNDGGSGGGQTCMGMIWSGNSIQDYDPTRVDGHADGRGGDMTENGAATGGMLIENNTNLNTGTAPTASNQNSSDGGIFLLENGNGSHNVQVSPTSATISTLTIPNDGSSLFTSGFWIASVVKGTGFGQWRQITNDVAGVLTVSPPWSETPTASSLILIAPEDWNIIEYNNQKTGNGLPSSSSGVEFYGSCHGCYVDSNYVSGVKNGLYDTAIVRDPTQMFSLADIYVMNNSFLNSLTASSGVFATALYSQVQYCCDGALNVSGTYAWNQYFWDNLLQNNSTNAVLLQVTEGGTTTPTDFSMDGIIFQGQSGYGPGLQNSAASNYTNLVDQYPNPNLNFWDAGYLKGSGNWLLDLTIPWTGSNFIDMTRPPMWP